MDKRGITNRNPIPFHLKTIPDLNPVMSILKPAPIIELGESQMITINMNIKIAIGTSLLIVASKSLIGFFIGDVLSMEIDWTFLISFTAIAGSGVIIGNYLNSMIDEKKLRNIFGYFILFMSAFIFFQEFIK